MTIFDNKIILTNLNKIKGINNKLSCLVCTKLGISSNIKSYNLQERYFNDINQLIYSKYNLKTNKDLKKITKDNILLLKRIKSYKGFRHYQNLPVNGQRTKTNSKTRKLRKIV